MSDGDIYGGSLSGDNTRQHAATTGAVREGSVECAFRGRAFVLAPFLIREFLNPEIFDGQGMRLSRFNICKR